MTDMNYPQNVSGEAYREAIARELYDSLPDRSRSASWDWALLNVETDPRIRDIWDQAGRIVTASADATIKESK
jgi:hypothetical protein